MPGGKRKYLSYLGLYVRWRIGDALTPTHSDEVRRVVGVTRNGGGIEICDADEAAASIDPPRAMAYHIWRLSGLRKVKSFIQKL